MPDPIGCKRLQNTDPAADIHDGQAAGIWQPWKSISTWIAPSAEPTGAATSVAVMQNWPTQCASWTAQQWVLSGCTWPRVAQNSVTSISMTSPWILTDRPATRRPLQKRMRVATVHNCNRDAPFFPFIGGRCVQQGYKVWTRKF